jgi:hypothetical protein
MHQHGLCFVDFAFLGLMSNWYASMQKVI